MSAEVQAPTQDTESMENVNSTQEIQKLMDSINKDQKALQKLVKAVLRENERTKGKKRRRSDENRKPSGFAIPVTLTDATCDFLGLPHATEMARTDVTKKVIAYIKGDNPEKHVLQDSNAPRYIDLDDRLQKLFNVDEDGRRTTWFNLQKLMVACYVKSDKKEKKGNDTEAKAVTAAQDGGAKGKEKVTEVGSTEDVQPVKKKKVKKTMIA